MMNESGNRCVAAGRTCFCVSPTTPYHLSGSAAWTRARDEAFYAQPRFVTHIDDGAIAAVTQLYREFFPTDGAILDLMSSWISHLPPEARYGSCGGPGDEPR